MVLLGYSDGRPSYRQLRGRRRLIRTILLIVLIWNTADVLMVRRHLFQSDALYQEPLAVPQERVYIASIHWNNELILRSHWNDAVLELAKVLGPENIHVSIVESGSWDGTKAALGELDQALDRVGVSRNISLSDLTHADEIAGGPDPGSGEEGRDDQTAGEGWIDTPRNEKELRRIPYLARLRNQSLRPLQDLVRRGVTFDRVLFLNDVVFTTTDVLNLLNTNGGIYAAACALDFSKPPLYYDTFALRDSHGEEHLMQTWPYFRSSTSRNAMKTFSPVPVTSCWNGMVSMAASPFLSDLPLQFRGVPDSLATSHVEGSECCLIHVDNPLSSQKGIYLNPTVRVGYNPHAYTEVHPAEKWLSLWQIFWALWENRVRRWTSTPAWKRWRISSRVAAWEAMSEDNREPGRACLVDEMQVLVANGWAHV